MRKMKIGVVGLGRQGPFIDEIIDKNPLSKQIELPKFDPYISGNRLYMARVPSIVETRAKKYFENMTLELFCENLGRPNK